MSTFPPPQLRPPPQPKAPKRTWMIAGGITLGVLALGGVLQAIERADTCTPSNVSGCTPATTTPRAPAERPVSEPVEQPDGEISRGVGSQDATDDIGTPELTGANSIGIAYVEIPITNRSSGRSDYFIEVVVESADGTRQLDTGFAVVNGLEPGQSTVAEAMVTTEVRPRNARVEVTMVQRTASN